MSFEKGQIFEYEFSERKVINIKESKIIRGDHRAVVLHKRETPYNTVLIAPITKASILKLNGKIPSNYVELSARDYPFILEEDSYINLDMIIAVDKKELEIFERFNKKITGILKTHDLYKLDFKIALTYELNRFNQTEFAKELNKEVENIIQFIDEEIKLEIKQLFSKIEDKGVLEQIIIIIDKLISALETSYRKEIQDGKYINN